MFWSQCRGPWGERWSDSCGFFLLLLQRPLISDAGQDGSVMIARTSTSENLLEYLDFNFGSVVSAYSLYAVLESFRSSLMRLRVRSWVSYSQVKSLIEAGNERDYVHLQRCQRVDDIHSKCSEKCLSNLRLCETPALKTMNSKRKFDIQPLSTLSLTSFQAFLVELKSPRSSKNASIDLIFRCNFVSDSTLQQTCTMECQFMIGW